MRRHILWLAVALVGVSTASAQSDSVGGWPVGSRVRVWTSAHRHVSGELTEVRGDTLIITKGGVSNHQWTLHADSTQRVEVSRGQYVSAERIVGSALAGAAAVLAYVVLFDSAMPDLCTTDCVEEGPTKVQLALIGAAGGALFGAVRLADRWEEVPRPVRVGIAPAHRQARVAFSFTFR